MKKFKGILNEGCVYFMRQFTVVKCYSKFRPTTHVYKIMFQYSTRVTKAMDDLATHPYGFDIVPFSYLSDKDTDHKYLVGW